MKIRISMDLEIPDALATDVVQSYLYQLKAIPLWLPSGNEARKIDGKWTFVEDA